MKNPILIAGIIMFGLFISQDTTKRWWAKYSHRYIPNTCMAIQERLEDKTPKSWVITCPGTENLIIKIKSKARAKNSKDLKAAMYRELANGYVEFAKLSNLETLEMLHHLTLLLEHPNLKILSKTKGKDAVRFPELKTKDQIALHLRATVRVKEIIK